MSQNLWLVARKEKVAFSIATGVVLFGVALVGKGVAQVQTGPGWEIPAASATNWILFGLISLVLYGGGIICYLRAIAFGRSSPSNRNIFWILLFFGLLITASSYLLDPGQWQITHRHLSAALWKSFVPIGVICGIVGCC